MTNWYENPEIHADEYEELMDLLFGEDPEAMEEMGREQFETFISMMEEG